MGLCFQRHFRSSLCCNWTKYILSFGNNVSFAAHCSERGSIMTMSDGYRSHQISLNGIAIKMITMLTIKNIYEKKKIQVIKILTSFSILSSFFTATSLSWEIHLARYTLPKLPPPQFSKKWMSSKLTCTKDELGDIIS